MISAFGVNHGENHDGAIGKSMLMPGFFKPAHELDSVERHVHGLNLRDKNLARAIMGNKGPLPDRGVQANGTNARKIWGAGTKTNMLASKPVVHASPILQPTQRVAGGHLARVHGSAKPNGRGGGQIQLWGSADATTMAHEKAHIAPRRNPWKFKARYQDPVRAGREEGRADFTANGGMTIGRYARPDREFQQGYHEVQAQMANAPLRRITDPNRWNRRNVAKSFVAGGYKPAHLLDEAERAEVAARTARRTKSKFKNPPNGGANWAARTFKPIPTRSTGSKIDIEHVGQSKLSSLTSRIRGKKLAGLSRSNGLGGGRIKVFTNQSKEDQAETLRHELAHVQVKRNPFRFKERMRDPERLGREEGRADYLASGKMTLGAYPGNEEFQRGYSAVQYRMQLHRNVQNMNRRRS